TGVSAGISALVPAPAGRFLLHAHLDGRLFATAADGRPVSWAASEGGGAHLAEGRLLIVDNGLALCHANATEFRQIYRHGPYIRHLYVEEEEPGLYLIVFGVRGWYGSEEDAHGPRLVVLAVRWEDESASLTIQEAVIRLAQRELYGITRLPARGPDEAGITLAIGTGGSLDSPFLEVKILREAAGLQVDPVVPRLREDLQWKSFETADPSEIRSRLRINLGSSIDALTVPGDNGAPPSVWLWLGMHDGRLRSFLWEDGTWLEGGRWSGRPVLDPILTYSPIRTLRCVQAPSGETFLAYGTADGVLGVVPLDRLAAAAGPVPQDHSGEPNQPWLHVIHSRRGSAICGVADYRDGRDWNLAFLTEGGGVILHHLGCEEERRQEKRFIHMGMRLDAFRLPVEARAFASLSIATDTWKILEGEETRKTHLPALIVGGNDGTVGQYLLLFPKFSERRGRIAVPRVCEIFRHQSVREHGEESSFIRSAGRESAHPWLRLCDVRESNLAWFSLWHVLQELHRAHLPSRSADGRLREIPDNLPELVAIYQETLRRLTDEVYGRKPLGIDAAKMLWSETARYANKILEMALQVPDEERQREALRLYNLLLMDLDYLANRWIGADQEAEARVLMHSFSDLFDWSGIVLIAQDSFSEELEETRQTLLFRVIRRRLRHDDIRVPLEAIRVLNTALLRALVTNGKWQAGWMFVQRPLGPQAHGFRDLLDLVGHLVRQQVGRLTPADPLYTEIARFFALSLLLVPDGILSVGQVICETRLVEYQTDVGRRILLHARRLQNRLAEDFALGSDVELRLTTLVDRFAQFLSREVDFGIDQFPLDMRFDPKSEQPWRRLLSEPEAPDAPPLHDRHYLAEYRKVLFTVSRLARLSPLENAPTDDEVFRWLDPGQEVCYFQGSQKYLRSLREQRKELLNLLNTASPQRGEIPFPFAQRELEIDEQPDLVEPLKTYYRQILAQWRRELDRRGQEAIGLVGLIDRFNRHVYRTSADDLMASLTELALRSAPLAFSADPTQGDLPLRLQIREHIQSHPFVSELFRRGSLLVQGSHLAATLLHVAKRWLDPQRSVEQPLFAGRLTPLKIREMAQEVARLEGVELAWGPEEIIVPAVCPGDELIWGTILRELARNVFDYCSDGEKGTVFRVVWHPLPLDGGAELGCVSIGGARPFLASLDEDVRNAIEKGEKPEALLDMVAAILKAPGMRYHVHRAGSGFGLFFLAQLFGLLGGDARAQLLLLDPRTPPVPIFGPKGTSPSLLQPWAGEFHRLKNLPLTMAFTWRGRP
ncbi:MAG TPA: hypothetical protein VJ885_18395, partial [Thermoanaerobaculia bacterium]|nr:hypothetical protein [Thermoanaerobaculia bacterium]